MQVVSTHYSVLCMCTMPKDIHKPPPQTESWKHESLHSFIIMFGYIKEAIKEGAIGYRNHIHYVVPLKPGDNEVSMGTMGWPKLTPQALSWECTLGRNPIAPLRSARYNLHHL